jgi:hypothetical protein
MGGMDIRNADVIDPEWQKLEVGDTMPLGPGEGFQVAALEPPRRMLLPERASHWAACVCSPGVWRKRPSTRESLACGSGRSGRRSPESHGVSALSSARNGSVLQQICSKSRKTAVVTRSNRPADVSCK